MLSLPASCVSARAPHKRPTAVSAMVPLQFVGRAARAAGLSRCVHTVSLYNSSHIYCEWDVSRASAASWRQAHTQHPHVGTRHVFCQQTWHLSLAAADAAAPCCCRNITCPANGWSSSRGFAAAAGATPQQPTGGAAGGAHQEEQQQQAGPPKLIVFGGRGFVGSAVCQEALRSGLHVVSVTPSGEGRVYAVKWADV